MVYVIGGLCNMKRIILIVLLITATFLGTVTVNATPKTMPDGNIFDPEYYATMNPDVVSLIGNDENTLYLHYKLAGASEGRLPYANQPVFQAATVPAGMVDVTGFLGKHRDQILPMVGLSVGPYDDLLPVRAYALNGGSQVFGNQLSINTVTKVVESVSFTASANKNYCVGNIYIGLPIANARTILKSQGWKQNHLNDAMSVEETHKWMRKRGEASEIQYVTQPSPGNDLFNKGNLEIQLEYSYPNELISRVWYGYK